MWVRVINENEALDLTVRGVKVKKIDRLANEVAELAVPGEEDSFREWSVDRLKERVREAVKLVIGGGDV